MLDKAWLRALGGVVLSVIMSCCLQQGVLPSLLGQSTNPPTGGPGGGPTLTLERSYGVLRRTVSDIPADVLKEAFCVAVYPSRVKAAFIVGGSYSRGMITCRSNKNFGGSWSNPSMVALEGGIGLQMGGQTTDLVLLIMNERVATSILSSKAKVGGDFSTATGPVGRSSADEANRADILSYGLAQGVLSGASLTGATIRPDNEANQVLYGREQSAENIVLRGDLPTPVAARPIIRLLNEISPKR
jgi:lipid-binding SYLF domain-containing protein